MIAVVPDLDGLMAAIAAAAPDLRGAACVAHRDVFDACLTRRRNAPADAHAAAIGVCRCCPALARCRAWVDGLPPGERPFGVTAGRVRDARY
jgi:hypothetical protein